jgi:hypothetical protein
MLRAAANRTAQFYRGIASDIVIIIVTLLATIAASEYDVLYLHTRFENDYVVTIIYMLCVLISFAPFIFLGNLVLLYIRGEGFELLPNEDSHYSSQPLVKDKEVFLLRPAWLVVKNSSRNSAIKDCYATLLSLRAVYEKDGALTDGHPESWERMLKNVNKPTLKWQYLKNSRCKYDIAPLSKEMVEVANLTIPLSNQRNSRTTLSFCENDNLDLNLGLGLYRVRIRVDGNISGEDRHQIFDGFLWTDIIEDENQEGSFQTIIYFNKGDPIKDKGLKVLRSIKKTRGSPTPDQKEEVATKGESFKTPKKVTRPTKPKASRRQGKKKTIE